MEYPFLYTPGLYTPGHLAGTEQPRGCVQEWGNYLHLHVMGVVEYGAGQNATPDSDINTFEVS